MGLIKAYASVKTDLPLAVVGDAPYAPDYIASLHATAYVQATEVGGTHPALVEAMGFGNVILANDVPEHRETLGDAGLYYHGPTELAAKLQTVLDDKALADDLRRRAHDRARRLYSWDAISDAYESWLTGLCEQGNQH